MSTLSTHVLDQVQGSPAVGVKVRLERDGAAVGAGVTDQEGRIRDLASGGGALTPGNYRLSFGTAEYWQGRGVESFYPEVVVSFTVNEAERHYHVPLLLSPFGYSTYRGT